MIAANDCLACASSPVPCQTCKGKGYVCGCSPLGQVSHVYDCGTTAPCPTCRGEQ